MFRRTLIQQCKCRKSSSAYKGPHHDHGGSQRLFQRFFTAASGDNNRLLLHQLFTKSQKEFLQQQQILFQETQQLAQTLQLHHHSILSNHNNNNMKHPIMMRTQNNNTNLLDSTFTVVIAGEFNAGKSSIVNALLGETIMETGTLPTTDSITVLTSQVIDDDTNNDNNAEVVIHSLPNHPLLQDVTLIDTPGTNAVAEFHHTSQTMSLLPLADIILFVTSADRPFPESERLLLESIQNYRKNIVILINKMDILETKGGQYGSNDKQKITQFVHEQAQHYLGTHPIILPLSAQHANHIKRTSPSLSSTTNTHDNNIWERSNFHSLEQLLKDNLTQQTKIKAKLINPINVMEGILKECLSKLTEKSNQLQTDIATVQLVTSQIKTWNNDLSIETTKYHDQIFHLLQNQKSKYRQVLKHISYIQQLSLLFRTTTTNNNDGVQQSIVQKVWMDHTTNTLQYNKLQEELDKIVLNCAESIGHMARIQGQDVMEYLGKRPSIVHQNLIGNVTAKNLEQQTRTNLLQNMNPNIQRMILSNYNDENKMQNTLQQSLQSIVIRSIGIQLSISTVIGTCTYMELLDDIYGATAALSVALFGGLIMVPIQNEQFLKHHESQWQRRCDNLQEVLKDVCNTEIQNVTQQISKGISPYTRYVDTEKTQVENLQHKCQQLLSSCHTLRKRINQSQKWS